MEEEEIQKILIVTQISAAQHKHPGGDSTTDIKISSDLAQAINDELYFYEQDLHDKLSSQSSRSVSIIQTQLSLMKL